MINDLKYRMSNIIDNLNCYLPGIYLILFAFVVLIAPFTLIFILATTLFISGYTRIMQVRTVVKQEHEIKRYGDFLWDTDNYWRSRMFF